VARAGGGVLAGGCSLAEPTQRPHIAAMARRNPCRFDSGRPIPKESKYRCPACRQRVDEAHARAAGKALADVLFAAAPPGLKDGPGPPKLKLLR